MTLTIPAVIERANKQDEYENGFLDQEEFLLFFQSLLKADPEDVQKVFEQMIEDGLGDFMNGVEIKNLQRALMNQGNELKTQRNKMVDEPQLDEDGNLMRDGSGKPVTKKVKKNVWEDDEEKILDWLWDYGGAIEGDDDEIDYDDMQEDMDHHAELDDLAAEIAELPTGVSDWGQHKGKSQDDEKQQARPPAKRKAPPRKSPAAKKGPTTKPGLRSKVKKPAAKRVAGAKPKVGLRKKPAARRTPSMTKSSPPGKKPAPKGLRRAKSSPMAKKAPAKAGKRTAGALKKPAAKRPLVKKPAAGAKKPAARKPAKKVSKATGGSTAVKPGSTIMVTDGKYKGTTGETEKFLAGKKKWGCKLANGKKVLLAENQFSLA